MTGRTDLLWKMLIAACATFAAVSVPLGTMLGLDVSGTMMPAVGSFVSIIFLIDVVVQHRKIAANVSTFSGTRTQSGWWLAADILAAAPVLLLPVPSLLRLLPLFKLARVAQMMIRWQRRHIRHANILRLTFFAFWLALGTHWIACGWLALRAPAPVTGDQSAYLHALYWTVQTLSTVGYGDVTPKSPPETLYAIGVMILGVAVYGYIIGNVAGTLSSVDPAKAHYLENLEKLSAFLRYRHIPHALQERIRQYYEYQWENRLGYDESDLLTSLPPNLKTELTLLLKKDIIERVPLFHGAGEDFVRAVALDMRPAVYLPGDVVFKAGDVARKMYFISKGSVEVLSKDGNTVYNTLKEGDFFGEVALFHNTPRTATVRAVGYCDLYTLDKDSFTRILAHFPSEAGHIKQLARERLARS